MLNITLNNEQEKFLEEQLKKGKDKTHQELIAKACYLLLKQEEFQETLEIRGGESAQKLLAKKLEQWREDSAKNLVQPRDTDRQKLAQEFRELCAETQALHADNPLTDAEIEEEINAYRRGE